MTVAPGQNLLQYRVVEKIGEGGMGQVWKAVDTTLDREVAIKVLPPELAAQPERLARFEREARLLALLNHPNVAAVQSFSRDGDERFVVMELVDGEDLSSRIARGRLPVSDAIEVAVQIAEGLAAAHERGVVHRDLKPANIRVTPDGTVKVLDLGLAKAVDATDSLDDANFSSAPTRPGDGTSLGVLIGTAAYMSPEQARGRPVDRRADLWAFGCVLFEMLTGRRAFEGESVTDVLSAVLHQEPDGDLLPEDTPEALRRLLRRCLDKRPTHRLRDAADARLDLLEAAESAASAGREAGRGAVDGRGRGGGRRLAEFLVAALLGGVAVGVVWWLGAPDRGALPPAVSPAHQVTFTGDLADPQSDQGTALTLHPQGMALAADGRTAAYLTRDGRRAVLIDLEGGGSQTLFEAEPGTRLQDLAWSPDGGRVHLMAWPYAEFVFSVPRLGGEPRRELDLGRLAGLNGIFVRPLRDGRWLISGDHNTLYVGDDPAGLEARGTQLHGDGTFRIEDLEFVRRVVASDDGRHVAFLGIDGSGRERAGIAAVTGATTFVDAWNDLAPVAWTGGGRTLWLWRPAGRDVGDLLRVSLDPSTRRPVEPPRLVHPGLSARLIEVSADGTRLALLRGDRVVNVHEFRLDAGPGEVAGPGRPRTRGTGRWTVYGALPDGALLAGLDGDLAWELFALSEEAQRSLVRRGRSSTWADGSPDGRSVAVAVNDPEPAILIHDLTGNRGRSIPVPEALSVLDWSPDGRWILAMTLGNADHFVLVDVEQGDARLVPLQCGERCEFAWEYVRFGPEWPYAAVTSEVDTWVLDVETGALRHLAADTYGVAAWRGDFVYFSRAVGQTDWSGRVLFRVPSGGGEEERLFEAPAACNDLQLGADGETVLCPLDESRLDLYVVDGIGR